jgi:hypothetical protein
MAAMRQAPGPVSESLQGRNPRVWGTPVPRALWDLDVTGGPLD